MAVAAFAQMTEEEERRECEEFRRNTFGPYYYCDCHMKNNVFTFPLDTVVRDTMWYTATMDDIKKGISAYWFADCSLTMEIYLFCTNHKPVETIRVGGNHMRDMSVDEVMQRLNEYGDQFAGSIASLRPHMRVYPNVKGCEGRVYCDHYDEGPESTCGDPMPLYPGMTYVCEEEENAYQMPNRLIPKNSKPFIYWYQKKNEPCEIWLTLDSCTGEEIDRFALSDTMHVHMLDSAMIAEARINKHDLWVHVKHAEGKTGRIIYYANPAFSEDPAQSVVKNVCLGKSIKVNERSYSADTVFTDTICLRDTLQKLYFQPIEVNLSFTTPAMEYDTVYLTAADMNAGYRHTLSGTTLYAFGDVVLEVKKSNACTRLIQLSLIEKEPEPMSVKAYRTRRQGAYKALRNGQLVIIVDDREYNLLGQEIWLP